jgi:FixJ family two-component response regulator
MERTTERDDPIVFVVDDDVEVREAISLLLRSAGIRSEAHGSAGEFLAAYDPQRASCLILDVRMPAMDGLQLHQHLRERGLSLPVIFITAFGDVPTAARAFDQGAVDVLQKPFRDQLLLDKVQSAIGREQEARRQRRMSRDAQP